MLPHSVKPGNTLGQGKHGESTPLAWDQTAGENKGFLTPSSHQLTSRGQAITSSISDTHTKKKPPNSPLLKNTESQPHRLVHGEGADKEDSDFYSAQRLGVKVHAAARKRCSLEGAGCRVEYGPPAASPSHSGLA